MKRGQVTTEFIIITSIVFLIFFSTVEIINQKNTHVIEYKKYLNAKDIGDKVAFMINGVHISGFGAQDFTYIPERMSDGTNFTLEIIPKQRLVVVKWEDQQYLSALVTSHISGVTTTIMGRVSAYNNFGEIIIEQ